MRGQESAREAAVAATYLVDDHVGGVCVSGECVRERVWAGRGLEESFCHSGGKEARDYKGVRENLVGSKIGFRAV